MLYSDIAFLSVRNYHAAIMVKEKEFITIKKYSNRRLYNTQTSIYITLDDVREMVRDEVEFRVCDAKTPNRNHWVFR